MDFERVLSALLQGLERRQVRYAAIGGFAINLLGVDRTTGDLDFLVHRDDLPQFHETMTALGFTCYRSTDDVSQYEAPIRALGSIDALHAFREVAVGMLQRAQSRPIFDGKLTLRVLQPEDIIGLKVQAMANNPKRLAHEQWDIESLIRAQQGRVDWERIQHYYELFGLGSEVAKLKERCRATE